MKRSLRQRSKPIQKEKGRSTHDNRWSHISGNRPTHLTHVVTIFRRAVTTRRNSPKGKEKTYQTFVPIEDQPRPRRGDPIAKVVNHMGEETHRNLHNQSQPESEGQARRQRNPWPNKWWAHNHRHSKSAYLRLIAKQQMRPGEDSPLSKHSDKPGNSAATSHKKFRQSDGGRMNATTRP